VGYRYARAPVTTWVEEHPELINRGGILYASQKSTF